MFLGTSAINSSLTTLFFVKPQKNWGFFHIRALVAYNSSSTEIAGHLRKKVNRVEKPKNGCNATFDNGSGALWRQPGPKVELKSIPGLDVSAKSSLFVYNFVPVAFL